MYKLFTDKDENFECKIAVEGTNLSKASARLVLESSEYNLIFEGKIDNTGKCIIPIKKLKCLSENLKGKLKLEVIVDNDTYFVPYSDDFTVMTNRKVTAEVIQPNSNIKSKKVIVEVTNKNKYDKVVDALYNVLKVSKINVYNIGKSTKAKNIISESLSKYKLSKSDILEIQSGLLSKFRNELK